MSLILVLGLLLSLFISVNLERNQDNNNLNLEQDGSRAQAKPSGSHTVKYESPKSEPVNTKKTDNNVISLLCEGFKGSYFSTFFNVSKIKSCFRPKYGAFSLEVDRNILIQQKLTRFKNNLNIRPNCSFACTGLLKTEKFTVANNRFYGFNRKFISSDGDLLTQEALTDYVKTHYDKYISGKKLTDDIHDFMLRDNHVSHILNMLISYFYMFIAEANTNGKVKVDPRLEGQTEIAYDDSFKSITVDFIAAGYASTHVKVKSNTNLDDGGIHRIKYQMPAANLAEGVQYVYRTQENHFSNNYCLSFPKLSVEQISFIMAHIGGRTTNNIVNFDISTPHLPFSTILVDGALNSDEMGQAVNMMNSEKLFMNADSMLSTICRYVEHNRLVYDYTIALEIINRVMFMPVAASLEGMWWQQNLTANLSIPQFSPTRALIRLNLTGEPYYIDSNITQAIRATSLDMGDVLVANTMANYVFYFGLYVLLDEGTLNEDKWRNSFDKPQHIAHMLDQPSGFSIILLFMLGYKVSTVMDDQYGILWDIIKLRDSHVVKKVEFLDPRERAHLTRRATRAGFSLGPDEVYIDKLYSSVSGVLLDGAIDNSYRLTKHMAPQMDFDAVKQNSLVITAPETMLAWSQVARYCNQDLVWKHYGHIKNHTAWAPAHEWMVEPGSVIKYDRWDDIQFVKVKSRKQSRLVGLTANPENFMVEGIFVSKSVATLRLLQYRSSKPAATPIIRRTADTTRVSIFTPSVYNEALIKLGYSGVVAFPEDNGLGFRSIARDQVSRYPDRRE